ncbi:MFS transporter [Spiroplasma endosymbiont of Stenodema calcarata]|uniref:MFS transporter n=1 Tax=Spiroplasma endosymbiont of Stenodema calcarata TaxID=3139328 RepID=UPI003CCA6FA0
MIFMPDTPQSKGLPSIEATSKIKKYTGKEIIVEESTKGYKYYFFKYVLFNKWIWIIASANFFIYVLRNGISDWMLKFLSDEHDFKLKQEGKWIWSLYEWGAIPGTIIIGFTANRYFKGKLTPLMIVAILITICAIVGIWLAPYKNISILAAMFAIAGFFIYGPVAFIGMQAMDFSHKKVVGTAAGLTGIFGYLGDTIGSKIIIGYGTNNIGNNYNATFIFLIICGISACLLLAFVWGKSYTLYKTNK